MQQSGTKSLYIISVAKKIMMMQSNPAKASPTGDYSGSVPDINNIPPASSEFFKPKGEFLHQDILWPVLLDELEQDPKMMRRIFETVEQVSVLSSRLLAVRYDLHLSEYQADNRVIEQFHRQLFSLLHRNYPKSFISYLWVREKDSAKAHHYHYVLMMDGNYIRYPSKVTDLVQQCWSQVAGGSVWVPENCFYFVEKDDIETYSKLMLRLSYLGKRRTKEPTSECRKRLGWGIRQSKSKRAGRCRKTSVSRSSEPETAKIEKEKTSTHERLPKHKGKTGQSTGYLDKLFLEATTLEAIKPPAKPVQPARKNTFDDWLDFSLEKLMFRPRPDWQWHRLNYVYEVFMQGMSMPEYARKYRLKLSRIYANFRQVGGQSLRAIRWAWHRRCFQLSGVSIGQYLAEHGLYERTAKSQIGRQPMSEFWSRHFEHYYRQYWPLGWTVAAYCDVHDLNVSTAQRYLVDFPKQGVINPLVLKPWL